MEFIAEIGWNHMGDMALLGQMVHAAKEAGATHAKFQMWRESRLRAGPWDDDGRREIYRKAELSQKQFDRVKTICDEAGIKFLTSVFDHRDVGNAAEIANEEIKIPSPEIANIRLLQEVGARFNKAYLSTGASTEAEIDQALRTLRDAGIEIVLMHCVSVYPCPDHLINLPRLHHLRKKHPKVGFSDHTPDILSTLFALGLGVVAIEKHFTIDRNLPGRDNKFAILPDAFSEMVSAAHRYKVMAKDCGIDFQPEETEQRTVYRGRWSGGE